MKTKLKNTLLHDGFLAGMFVKGIDGVLEIIGGFLLMMVNTSRLDKMAQFFTQHELSLDKQDVISNSMIKLSHGFTISTQHFGIYYLLSHGVMKLFLVFMLLEKKLWAYPVAVVFLALFIGYQLYRFSFTHSLWLLGFTCFDSLMIALVWSEHNRIIDIYFKKRK